MDVKRQPGIRFTGVDLRSLEFRIHGQEVDKLTFGPSFEVESILSEDKKSLEVILTTDLFGRLDPGSKPPIDFRFVLHAHFESGSEPNLPLEEFAGKQAPAHLMPYVRELVSNITSRSALPTLNLGPVNIVALIEANLNLTNLDIHQASHQVQQD